MRIKLDANQVIHIYYQRHITNIIYIRKTILNVLAIYSFVVVQVSRNYQLYNKLIDEDVFIN